MNVVAQSYGASGGSCALRTPATAERVGSAVEFYRKTLPYVKLPARFVRGNNAQGFKPDSAGDHGHDYQTVALHRRRSTRRLSTTFEPTADHHALAVRPAPASRDRHGDPVQAKRDAYDASVHHAIGGHRAALRELGAALPAVRVKRATRKRAEDRVTFTECKAFGAIPCTSSADSLCRATRVANGRPNLLDCATVAAYSTRSKMPTPAAASSRCCAAPFSVALRSFTPFLLPCFACSPQFGPRIPALSVGSVAPHRWRQG